MQLLYKIDFNSTSSYYKEILEGLIGNFSINALVDQYKGFIVIRFEDEGTKIEEFFKFIETRLPLSIFLEKAQVIETIDHTITPLIPNNISSNLSLLTNEKIKNILEDNDVDFLNDILTITKSEVSKLETKSGLIDIFLPSKDLRQDFEQKGFEVKLLLANIEKVSEIFDVNAKDMQLLCSIERPLVKLKFKLTQNRDNEYSSSNFIYVKLPDDEQTLLFANSLKQKDIDTVLYVSKDSYQDGMKITYNNEQNIIISGDRGLFPKYDYTANKKFDSLKEYFQENGGIFKSVLAQFGKRIVPSVGIYFSLKSKDSKVQLNLPTKGLRDVIHVCDTPTNLEVLCDEISCIDEDRQRLVENYKNKFTEIFENKSQEDVYGFESLMLMSAKVLGIDSAKEFEDLALSMNIKSGLQIDFKIMKVDRLNYIDYKKTVQSIMSYKMADVDNGTLAYSFFESLSEFICNYSDEISKEIKSKDIVLCGDMFANSILLSKTLKNLSKNYNVLLPKEYPLDY